MIDETASQSAAAGPSGPDAGSAETVVAFCQQCGRALTASTKRQVGTSVFCEPCATARQAAGWTPVNAAPAAPYPQDPLTSSEFNPALAGFLGLIPGVGAMYNGQYAKGVIHLVVFVVLVSLADNLNWVFWWLVWGWIFYQGFEAYHTARARRDGLPLPDPFGWNELGERLGFTRPTAPRPSRPVRVAGFQPVPPASASVAPEPPPPPVQAAAVPLGSAGSPAPFSQPSATPPVSTSYRQVPYTPTYTGNAPVPPPGAPVGQPYFVRGGYTFPLGAVWLIALGILFLLGNILPAWHITGRWLVPIILAAMAFWIGSRRIMALQQGTPIPGVRPSLADALLAPCMLLTVAVLLAMQVAYWIPLKHSWPALLIVWGALLLIQRSHPSDPLAPSASSPPLGSAAPPPPAADRSSR